MRGRKKKPAAVSKMDGNPGKRPLNEGAPKGPPLTSLVAPSWLKAEALEVWNERAPMAAGMGTLTAVDVEMFAGFCVAAGAVAKAAAIGEVDHKSLTAMRSLGSEFGISAASRERLGLNKGGKEVDEFEAFTGHQLKVTG